MQSVFCVAGGRGSAIALSAVLVGRVVVAVVDVAVVVLLLLTRHTPMLREMCSSLGSDVAQGWTLISAVADVVARRSIVDVVGWTGGIGLRASVALSFSLSLPGGK